MIRKRLYSLTGICMATLLYAVPVCAAENTTESSTGLAVINSTGQPSMISSQMSQEYIESALNNIQTDSIMTDTTVIEGRTNGFNSNTASSWLNDALSDIKIEGIDTSKYNIVNTSENLDILNAKYAAAKTEMESNNYYTAFKAKANSTENKSTTAESIFKDTYKDVYDSIGKKTEQKSISDVISSYGGTINSSKFTINSDKSENKTALKLVADKDKTSVDYRSDYNKRKNENQNVFSSKSDDIDKMINTFKADLNSNYSGYINSDAYKAVYSSIASTNVTDKIATRQVLPTTISEAALMAQINSLSEQIPISADTARQKAEANKAATQAGYNSNKNALDASAMQTYTAAVASAKANSGYMDAYKSYLDTSENTASVEQNNVTTTLVFDNQDEFESFVKLAGLAGIDDEDDSYYYYASTDDEISDNRTYIHLDGNSLVLNTQESSMFSNAIKNSGAKITTVEDTDYLTWKKDENYDVQEKAKENHMKAVLDEGAKKINGEK